MTLWDRIGSSSGQCPSSWICTGVGNKQEELMSDRQPSSPLLSVVEPTTHSRGSCLTGCGPPLPLPLSNTYSLNCDASAPPPHAAAIWKPFCCNRSRTWGGSHRRGTSQGVPKQLWSYVYYYISLLLGGKHGNISISFPPPPSALSLIKNDILDRYHNSCSIGRSMFAFVFFYSSVLVE